MLNSMHSVPADSPRPTVVSYRGDVTSTEGVIMGNQNPNPPQPPPPPPDPNNPDEDNEDK